MQDEKKNARMYDLVEMYDFNELSEKDKDFVLEHFSQKEYNELRETITDTKEMFSSYSFKNKKHFALQRIASYPIELYKIAAAVVLIIGLGFLITNKVASNHAAFLATTDTLFVVKTDTVIIKTRDTINKTIEKIVYKNVSNPAEQVSSYAVLKPGNVGYKSNCSIEICPNDIRNLSAVKGNNSLSTDSITKDFIVVN